MPGDINTSIRIYLNTRYTTSYTDVQPLIKRYLAENPNSRNDQTKVFKDLELAAKSS
jgi:hypothetical protein